MHACLPGGVCRVGGWRRLEGGGWREAGGGSRREEARGGRLVGPFYSSLSIRRCRPRGVPSSARRHGQHGDTGRREAVEAGRRGTSACLPRRRQARTVPAEPPSRRAAEPPAEATYRVWPRRAGRLLGRPPLQLVAREHPWRGEGLRGFQGSAGPATPRRPSRMSAAGSALRRPDALLIPAPSGPARYGLRDTSANRRLRRQGTRLSAAGPGPSRTGQGETGSLRSSPSPAARRRPRRVAICACASPPPPHARATQSATGASSLLAVVAGTCLLAPRRTPALPLARARRPSRRFRFPSLGRWPITSGRVSGVAGWVHEPSHRPSRQRGARPARPDAQQHAARPCRTLPLPQEPLGPLECR